MERPAVTRPKTRRSLSRTQITDILERNVQLYKEEDNFVRYLVELAIYLMEYEYDWAESGADPPVIPVRTAPAPEPPPAAASSIKPAVGKIVFSKMSSQSAPKKEEKVCPFCGTNVGELLICPSCRNLTR